MVLLFDNIDVKTLFWYIIIFFTIIYIFTNTHISSGLLYGTLISLIIFGYLFLNYENNKKNEETVQDEMIKYLPNHDNIIKRKDIANFIFSIHDFYPYNQQSYENMIEFIDTFLIRYQDIKHDNSIAGISYQTLINKKRGALNALSSIIIKIPPNKKYDKKLENSLTSLNDILDEYINEVYLINKNYIYENGIHTSTIFIDKRTIPSRNTYDDEFFSYDIF